MTLQGIRQSLVETVRVFESMRSAVHSYATDCQISLQFGNISNDIFDKTRESVDLFVRSACPKAAEQLLSAYERLRAGDPEARAQCLTTCRRILLTVADAIYPAQPAEYRDRTGRSRKVGPDEYKNRLLAFLDRRLESENTFSLVTGEIEHLVARLDAVYEKVSKGVHSDVTADEAQLAVIHTYLFLAEIARVQAFAARTVI